MVTGSGDQYLALTFTAAKSASVAIGKERRKKAREGRPCARTS